MLACCSGMVCDRCVVISGLCLCWIVCCVYVCSYGFCLLCLCMLLGLFIRKIQLKCSLVTSIFLFTCESWTLTAELQKRIHAMEMRCYRKILCISYKAHVTNKEVYAKIQQAIGPHEDLLTTVKRRKLQWYGHIFCSSGLAKTILQCTVKGGRRQRGGRGGKTMSGNGQS